jgi:hypothetical protein
MHRFGAMVESAWNLTESYRPMSYLTGSERRQLHADHREMLTAFVASDTETLLSCAAAHHDRLRQAIASMPPARGLFLDEPVDDALSAATTSAEAAQRSGEHDQSAGGYRARRQPR